jgi:hypothetical protein
MNMLIIPAVPKLAAAAPLPNATRLFNNHAWHCCDRQSCQNGQARAVKHSC